MKMTSNCQCHHLGLHGFDSNHQLGCEHMGSPMGFSLADALTNPTQVMDHYVGVMKKEGTKIAIVFGVSLAVFNWLMLHQALNQKIKKVGR